MKSGEWYSWIPTNLGELNFYYFAKAKELEDKYKNIYITRTELKIERLDVSFISDTYTPLSKWLNPILQKFLPSFEREVYGSIDFHVTEDSLCKLFRSKIELSYQEIFRIEANIDIEYTGKCKIYNFKIDNEDSNLWQEFDSFEDFQDYLAQVLFIITKGLLHGDNHHHQKIDTAITVTKGAFNPEKILQNLIKHVKRVEHDIKNFDRCYGRLKALNAIEEMKGYRSYINTFRTLFLVKDRYLYPKYVADSNILNNIIASLEANVKKNENKFSFSSSIISTILVYLAAIISSSVLYLKLLAHGTPKPVIHNGIDYIIGAIIFIGVAFFHLRCAITSSLFYHNYNFYEYIFHLAAIEKPNNLWNKIIKFFWKIKYALLALILTGLVALTISLNFL